MAMAKGSVPEGMVKKRSTGVAFVLGSEASVLRQAIKQKIAKQLDKRIHEVFVLFFLMQMVCYKESANQMSKQPCFNGVTYGFFTVTGVIIIYLKESFRTFTFTTTAYALHPLSLLPLRCILQ